MREGPAAAAEWAGFARELALNLQRHRHAARLTQEQVAERAGISLYAYQTYERGTAQGQPVNPRLATMLAIAEVLNAPLNELLPKPPRLTSR